MRALKFRAWDTKERYMIFALWINGNGTIRVMPDGDPDKYHCLEEEKHNKRYKIMQYTGLKDKNGLQKIYENDIIDPDGNVIGNKYENDDLLDGTGNWLIFRLGTADWIYTHKEALERGCKYAE